MPDLTRARDAFLVPEGVTYLDTASNAPRLRAVDAAARAAWDAGIAPWEPSMAEWEARLEHVRAQASRLFHADLRPDPDGVALLHSVAQAMALVAASWPLREGDVVAMLDGEFPSTLMPWQRRCAQAAAHLRTVPRERATDWLLERLGRERLDVLVLSQAHWRDGRWIDLDAVSDAARVHGVPMVLDLSQSLGATPCDVVRWAPAFAASVGYKWLLGGKGLAPLWIAPAWRERVEPFELHWQQRAPARPWGFGMDALPAPKRGARALDGGEIADPLRLAIAEAGIAQVLEWTPTAITARLGALTACLSDQIDAAGLGAWRLSPPSPHLVGVAPPADRLEAVRAALVRERIVCVERDGVFRIAPHLHVDESDIDLVAAALIGSR